jgi:mannose-6-phosphate isomerase-like protein (cupin superfamily)
LNSRLDYVPSERYEDIRNFVVRAPAEGATLFNSPDNQASYVLVRRTKPGNVEEHSRWDDLIIVPTGTGDIVRIPAGVPHAFTPTGNVPWEFLLIKVRRPNKSLEVPPATTPSNN